MRGSDLQLAWRWMSRGLQINTELTQNISAQCDEPNVSIQVGTTQNEDRTSIPKFTLLVSRQCFLSKTNQIISTKFPSTTFHKSTFSNVAFLGVHFHGIWTAGRKRQQSVGLSESFKPWTNFARVEALKFVAMNVYIFSCSFPAFLASSLSLNDTDIHTHLYSHLCMLENLLCTLQSHPLFQAQVHTHNPL